MPRYQLESEGSRCEDLADVSWLDADGFCRFLSLFIVYNGG